MEQIEVGTPYQYIEFPIVESFTPLYVKAMKFEPVLIKVDYILRCEKSNRVFTMACRLLPEDLKMQPSRLVVVKPIEDESSEMDIFINFENLV